MAHQQQMVELWNYMNQLGFNGNGFNNKVLVKKRELKMEDEHFTAVYNAWATTLSKEFPPTLKKLYRFQ